MLSWWVRICVFPWRSFRKIGQTSGTRLPGSQRAAMLKLWVIDGLLSLPVRQVAMNQSP